MFKGVFIARTCFPDDCRGPPRGFGDTGRKAIYFQGFGEKGHLFSGIWGEGSFIFRDLGRKHNFLGFREQVAGG